MSPIRNILTRRSPTSSRSWKNDWPNSRRRVSFWKRSVWSSARATIWKCCARWAIAPALKTTRVRFQAVRQAARRIRCSISSRRILSPSSTKATLLCRRLAVCTLVTVRARKTWWSTVSGCRRRWTTVHCILKSSRKRFTRRFMFQRHRVITNLSTASRLWSRSSAQRGFWIRPSRSIRSPGRSTISSIACVGALCATSVCS